MNEEHLFRSVKGRIRRVLAWRAASVGLALGVAVALVLAIADWQRWVWLEWTWLPAAPIAGFVAGWLWGRSKPIEAKAVAASLDRRAKLQDRIASSLDAAETGHPFAHEIQADARESMRDLDPKRLYPIRFSRWHSVSLAMAVLAALLVLLGNTPFLRSPADRKEQEELKKQGEEIVKIVKPVLEERGLGKPTEDYARQLEQFARELERSRHDKKEALKKTNDLLSQGQDLQKQLEKKLEANLDRAQQSIEKMLADRLAQQGIQARPEDIREQLNSLLRAERPEYQQAMEANRQERASLQSQKKELQSQIDDLKKRIAESALNGQEQKAMKEMLEELESKQNQIDEQMKDLAQKMSQAEQALQEQLAKDMGEAGDFEKKLAEAKKELDSIMNKLKSPNLTEAQRKALEEKAKALRELMKQLKMSKELQDGLKALYSEPQMKEILKRMAELMQKAKFAEGGDPEESGAPPKLTPEEIAELQAQLDEMGRMLSDPKLREEMLKALKEALDNMDELTLSQGMCMGLGMCMLPGMSPIGSASHGGAFADTNWVNKLEKPEKGQGKTMPTRVTGERHPTLGKESFIETKGPARLGPPSKVPYLKILPKYRQALEEALKKQQIPKDQEQRVRDYFRSLGGQ